MNLAARSFCILQKAVVDQLVRKTRQVILTDSFKSFGLSGGVANNELLRTEFGKLCQDQELKFLPAEKRHGRQCSNDCVRRYFSALWYGR